MDPEEFQDVSPESSTETVETPEEAVEVQEDTPTPEESGLIKELRSEREKVKELEREKEFFKTLVAQKHQEKQVVEQPKYDPDDPITYAEAERIFNEKLDSRQRHESEVRLNSQVAAAMKDYGAEYEDALAFINNDPEMLKVVMNTANPPEYLMKHYRTSKGTAKAGDTSKLVDKINGNLGKAKSVSSISGNSITQKKDWNKASLDEVRAEAEKILNG